MSMTLPTPGPSAKHEVFEGISNEDRTVMLSELRLLARSSGWDIIVRVMSEQSGTLIGDLSVPSGERGQDGIAGVLRSEFDKGQLKRLAMCMNLPAILISDLESQVEEPDEDD